MDYRCPFCDKDLGSRKQIHAIITRMEIDCTFCNKRIRLNLHPLEEKIVFASFGLFLVLVVLAYALKSEGVVVLALIAGSMAPAAMPLLERTWLKTWPRYVPAERGPDRDGA